MHSYGDMLIVHIAQQIGQGCTMAKQVGKAPPSRGTRNTWVQTERSSHEAWSRLIASAPMAARLAHVLVANMDGTNAVVASQATLGELMAEPGKKPVHRNSVANAIKRLKADRWIEVVQLGGKGGALAYIVNDRVAWGRSRDDRRYSRFSAHVIASSSEQSEPINDRPPLRQIPTLMRGEQQLPSGPSAEPPTQPSLDGFEQPLPEIRRDDEGRAWEVNPITGEAQRVIEEREMQGSQGDD